MSSVRPLVRRRRPGNILIVGIIVALANDYRVNGSARSNASFRFGVSYMDMLLRRASVIRPITVRFKLMLLVACLSREEL